MTLERGNVYARNSSPRRPLPLGDPPSVENLAALPSGEGALIVLEKNRSFPRADHATLKLSNGCGLNGPPRKVQGGIREKSIR